jgi:hypothetical protein
MVYGGNDYDEQSNGKHIGHSDYRSDNGAEYEKEFVKAEQARDDSTSTTVGEE